MSFLAIVPTNNYLTASNDQFTMMLRVALGLPTATKWNDYQPATCSCRGTEEPFNDRHIQICKYSQQIQVHDSIVASVAFFTRHFGNKRASTTRNNLVVIPNRHGVDRIADVVLFDFDGKDAVGDVTVYHPWQKNLPFTRLAAQPKKPMEIKCVSTKHLCTTTNLS